MSKFFNLAGNDVMIRYKKSHKIVTSHKDGVTRSVTVIYPKYTNVTINTKHGEKLNGIAACSTSDMCNKEKGRKMAIKRALQESTTLTKEERAEFWNAYKEMKPNGRW